MDAPGPRALEIIQPRETSLGGPDGTRVRRTLPTRERSLIGGWCFVDHYGPEDVTTRGGMQVPPHPHTGLQTVSWLFEGEVEHRDSAGNLGLIRPGEVNLMTAGRGVSHSETSTGGAVTLHGVQLWIALPEIARHAEPSFSHHVPDVRRERGVSTRVLVGSLMGSSSPVHSYSPLLGAELTLDAGTVLDIPVDSSFEHGLLVDMGDVRVDGAALARDSLGYLPPGRNVIRLQAITPTRLLILGGAPLGERIVMWWNFIARSHDEIAELRVQWQLEVEGRSETIQFGMPVGDPHLPLSAPDLPPVRLKPRG